MFLKFWGNLELLHKEIVCFIKGHEFNQEKSHIRETPTLLTDADSRTDTNLERLRDLPIRTKKVDLVRAKMRTLSTLRWGLGPRKLLTPFTPEYIPIFRALLEIEIQIKIQFRNTSSFLGLYSRSRLNSGTHPHF